MSRAPALRLALPLALLALVALAAVPPTTLAQGAAPPARQAAPLSLTAQGGEAEVYFPFRLAADGEVYAKVLPTPWNPVLPGGVANGTVAPDRSAGRSGWWVSMRIATADGALHELGHFADDGASAPVTLQGNANHALVVRVHAPARAGAEGQEHRVDLALVHRDGANTGTFDGSWGLAAILTVQQAAPAPLALDLTLPLLGAAALVVGGATVVAARRLRARRAEAWF